ncbi:hypothetical protein U1Q18_033350 [Sarracenia purpurea var. burkii]
MVLQDRLGYGFNGYQVPPTPRATRSARRRGSNRKKVDDSQMCAFDLLATLAGKLLLEGHGSPISHDTLTGKEPCTIVKDSIKSLHAHNDDCSGFASGITSDCSEKFSGKSKIQPGSFTGTVEVASFGYESLDCTLGGENNKRIKMEPPKTGNVSNSTKTGMCASDGLEVRHWNPPSIVSIDNSVKLPLGTDHIPSGPFPTCRDDVKLVIRDDDENSSGCIQPCTTKKAFRPSPRIGDRRIRKLLASKYWKVTPKLKDGKHFSADAKPVYHNRKSWYKRQRSRIDYPLKKRILYDRSSVSNSSGGIRSGGISTSPRKRFSCEASGSGTTMQCPHGAGLAGRQTPFQSGDSHVKLRIKSLKIPELFIEIPESATVCSLKRTVMEAVTSILGVGGGLQIGVLLQGNKLRDDNKTLLQSGISHYNKLDALGFSLEPSPLQAPSPQCQEDHPLLLTSDPPQPLTRYPLTPSIVHEAVQQSTADSLPDPPLTNLGICIESDHDLAPSPSDMSIDTSQMDSRALVNIPAMNAEELAAMPMKKSEQPEAVQRRIRRPFSVFEVEALVQAVEKLGTGRWRDVKLRAFDNAKHRTYVDLKDKWKTLVHTARISPQQRRGEPVPQELLDRVLTAHDYWSQWQAKQQHLEQQQQSDESILTTSPTNGIAAHAEEAKS